MTWHCHLDQLEVLQDLVTEAELDVSRQCFSFSKTKTVVMVLHSKFKDIRDPDVLLYNTSIEMSSAEMLLGIVRSDDHSYKTTIVEWTKCMG